VRHPKFLDTVLARVLDQGRDDRRERQMELREVEVKADKSS